MKRGISISFFVFVILQSLLQSNAIRVSVMLPLDTITNEGQLNNPGKLKSDLMQLKSGGVDGVMTDVWWGIVERSGPKQYDWSAYIQLATLVQSVGLKMQVVMSFHQCGTNIGDACFIPLPPWVLSVGQSNPDIFYKDNNYQPDQEYLSLSADNLTLFSGRSAVDIYSDFMISFSKNFTRFLGSTINEIQVGLGPAGEMRYPSYQLQNNKWSYCGIGEFQSYDKYMLSDLKQQAQNAGHPEWGRNGPDDAGNYNSMPGSTGFFSDGTFDNYSSDYGRFFLSWYSGRLLAHGSAILGRASAIFRPLGVPTAAKVSGIHWWYNSDAHAAELTAGYYNTNGNNGYLNIAKMFAQTGTAFDFTCLEMTDSPNGCGSSPEELVKQTRLAANQAGIEFSGENALPICQPNCNSAGFDQVYKQSTQYGNIKRFTYLRLDDNLLSPNNFNIFSSFVQRMHNAGDERESVLIH